MSSADANYSPAIATSWRVDTARDVAKLAGASGISVLLTIVAAPLMTRLYSPDALGVLGAFTSILFVITVPASLRYEFAIPIAESAEDERSLATLSVMLLVAFVTMSTVCIGVFELTGPDWQWWRRYGDQLWLLPPAVFAMGLFQVVYYRAVGAKQFSDLAVTSLARHSSESLLQIVLGLFALGATGLVGGTIASYYVGATALIGLSAARNKATLPRLRMRSILDAANRYRRYAVYSTPSSLCNAAGAYLPAFLLAIYFGPECAGWFLLADRVFALPSRVVGRAVSDVYFGEAARCIRERPHHLYAMNRQSTRILIVPTLAIFLASLVGGPAFAWIFGPAWGEAGVYAQILAAAFAARFLVLAITQLTTYGLNHWQLGWDVFRLAIVCGTLFACFNLGCTARTAIGWYGGASVFSFAVLYLLNLLAVQHTVNQRARLDGLVPAR